MLMFSTLKQSESYRPELSPRIGPKDPPALGKFYDKANIALYTMFIDFEHYKHLITKFS